MDIICRPSFLGKYIDIPKLIKDQRIEAANKIFIDVDDPKLNQALCDIERKGGQDKRSRL